MWFIDDQYSSQQLHQLYSDYTHYSHYITVITPITVITVITPITVIQLFLTHRYSWTTSRWLQWWSENRYPGVDVVTLVKFLQRGSRLDAPVNAACTTKNVSQFVGVAWVLLTTCITQVIAAERVPETHWGGGEGVVEHHSTLVSLKVTFQIIQNFVGAVIILSYFSHGIAWWYWADLKSFHLPKYSLHHLK